MRPAYLSIHPAARAAARRTVRAPERYRRARKIPAIGSKMKRPRPPIAVAGCSVGGRFEGRTRGVPPHPKAGFGGQERGEVKKAPLHQQSILLRQFLQRHL